MLKIYRGANFLSKVLIPFILVGYFITFEYLISSILLLPDGVNYNFVSKSRNYLFLYAVGNALIYFALFRSNKREQIAFNRSIHQLSAGDFLLLLLPLTPVVQYIINNQDILSPLGSLRVFILFVLISGLYIFAIPVLLKFVRSTRLLMIVGLGFVFTLMSMASLTNLFAWFEFGNLKIQWMFFGGVILVTWLLDKNKRMILPILITVIFVTNSTGQLFLQRERIAGDDLPVVESKLLSLIGERIPASTPNIYLLVYDAYVPNETMLGYGIDNSSQEQYLEGVGFNLYPQTYSVAALSIDTMSRVLNASTEFYGNSRRAVSGDGIIQNALKGFGYETYGIFPYYYFFHKNDSTYDFSFPEHSLSSEVLMRAILIGEFRFDVMTATGPRDQFIATRQKVLTDISRNPRFIYIHSDIPSHTQNSGVCQPEETNDFIARLASANIEMRGDINTIIINDPNAIVIVAGDHGPFLTKNCQSTNNVYDISEISRLDIQDRFGTFLAIRWPTEDFAKFDEITVLQDLFPAIFAYLFEDEIFLEAKIIPFTLTSNLISGVSVQNGIIYGGINDGEPLFVSD